MQNLLRAVRVDIEKITVIAVEVFGPFAGVLADRMAAHDVVSQLKREFVLTVRINARFPGCICIPGAFEKSQGLERILLYGVNASSILCSELENGEACTRQCLENHQPLIIRTGIELLPIMIDRIADAGDDRYLRPLRPPESK